MAHIDPRNCPGEALPADTARYRRGAPWASQPGSTRDKINLYIETNVYANFKLD